MQNFDNRYLYIYLLTDHHADHNEHSTDGKLIDVLRGVACKTPPPMVNIRYRYKFIRYIIKTPIIPIIDHNYGEVTLSIVALSASPLYVSGIICSGEHRLFHFVAATASISSVFAAGSGGRQACIYCSFANYD